MAKIHRAEIRYLLPHFLELHKRNEQIAALQEVVGGADVFSCHTAKLLREIEVIAPELIEIGHPMGVYKAIDPHPYFGAIVTRCGVEYLENIQKQTRDE